MPTMPPASSPVPAAPVPYVLRRRAPGAPCRVRIPALDVELVVGADPATETLVPAAVVDVLAADASLSALLTWTPWTPETGASRRVSVAPSDTPAQE